MSKAGCYHSKVYAKTAQFIRTKQVVTRSAVVAFLVKEGKSPTAAMATATVLLSPRKEESKIGKVGRSLGNRSADGIHYFMIPLKKKTGEEKKFRFHLCTPEEVIVRTALDAKRPLPPCRKLAEAVAAKKRQAKIAAKAKKNKPIKKSPAKKVIKAVPQVKTVVAPVAVETKIEVPVQG